MKQIFGPSPLTSIAGYLLAGLMVAQELMQTGEVNPWKITIAIVVAILGRVSKDVNKTGVE